MYRLSSFSRYGKPRKLSLRDSLRGLSDVRMGSMADVFPPDPTTDVGLTRVLLNDVAQDEQGNYKYYSDAELGAIIGAAGSVNRAVAHVYRVIASDQALLLKSYTTDDLQVRGDLIAEFFRKLANDFDSKANAEELASGGDFFDAVDGRGSFGYVHAEGSAFTSGEFPTHWPWR